MAKQYTISEARANFPTVVDEAESGRQIALTRRGKAVAMVISIHEYERLAGTQASFGEAYKNFLTKFSLDEVGVDPDYFSSVRESSDGRKVSL
ncbi:MAG: type II toxin-antitoxin system Phd/YefM family antitoxin [Planctomycetota bacterium]